MPAINAPQRIRNDIDVFSYHRPGFLQTRIFVSLVLVDLEHMVGSMCREKPPNGVILQIGIDSAEEYADVVAIGGPRLQSVFPGDVISKWSRM